MTALPSLSVIVPCYNAQPFVLDAVRSVLDQGQDAEVVVVDDGSTDGSAQAVAAEFGDRVRIVGQANAGVSAARNRGVAESHGELVVWLDADDALAPDTLLLRRQVFADDPGLEMLVGLNRIENRRAGTFEIWPPPADTAQQLTAGVLRRRIPHFNVLTFRRSALERLGPFDATLRTGEDYDMWLRAWATLRWRIIYRILASQRTNEIQSLTQRNGPVNNYRDIGQVLHKNRQLFDKTFGSRQPWRQAYGSWATDFALVQLHAGARWEMVRWSLVAVAVARGLPEFRAYKFLLEGLLGGVYRCAARGVRYLQRMWGTLSTCRASSLIPHPSSLPREGG